MNHGYFAVLVAIAFKMHNTTDTAISSYFDDKWKIFFSEKIFYWQRLFERKLCSELPQRLSIVESSDGFIVEKHEDEAEDANANTNSNDNPFKSSKEEFFISNNNVS